jgi:hypothetical protein
LSKVIRNEHQQQKYEQLELLASQANGRIVELGAYLGYGTIALCTGAAKGTIVYTVDDYQNRKGWAGEVYYPNDKQAFERNCELAQVLPILIERDVQVAAGEWPGVSISLLVWDLGIPARLCEDFDAWASHVVKGGKFVIHDTDDNRLGSDLLNPLGWNKYKGGVFWILERKL